MRPVKHITLCTLTLLLITSALSAQRLSAWLDAAEKAFAGGNYHAAVTYYQTALQIEPHNLDIQFQLAEAARHYQAFNLADSLYQSITQIDTAGQYPLAWLYQASVNQQLGRFEQAIALYDTFLVRFPHIDPHLKQRAEAGKTQCQWATERMWEVEEGMAILPLPQPVNDPKSDFAPVTGPQGNLYFSSFRELWTQDSHFPKRPLIQVYQWTSDQPDQAPYKVSWNQPNRHTAHTAFSPFGKYLFFTLCDYVGEAKIRCSLWRLHTDSLNAMPQPLPDTINLPGFTTTEPSIGYVQAWQKEVLFFASDRPGGKGEFDIWYAELDTNGMPGMPHPLQAINTAGNELTPFFHTPTQTLYFSTNGQLSLGGLDIYAVSIDSTGLWHTPQHMPPPLNSTYDEAWFWLSNEGGSGWFASNRPGSMILDQAQKVCCFDIYQMQWRILQLLAHLRDDKTGYGLEKVQVKLFALTDSVPLHITTIQADSLATLPLEKGRTYIVQFEKDGYYTHTDTIDLTQPKLQARREIARNYLLQPDHLDLYVRALDEETNQPLTHVEFRVVDHEGYDVAYFASDQSEEQAHAQIPRGQRYVLIASKIGYLNDTLTLDLPALGNPYVLYQEVQLRQKRIEDFPPIILYFDNDQPDPGSHSRRTDKTYRELYVKYFRRKPLFIDEYTKVLKGQDRLVAAERIEVFFDREVANGYENLMLFSELVLEALKSGLAVELIIKGYASPLGDDQYNEILAKRRVAVLENHFKTYKNGAFIPYMKSGQFKLTQVAYGERLAPQYISDSARDERESVYSVAASLERRVEIIGVKLGPFKNGEAKLEK